MYRRFSFDSDSSYSSDSSGYDTILRPPAGMFSTGKSMPMSTSTAPLCRFFVLGKCRYGSRCTYSHSLPQNECSNNGEEALASAAALVDCPYFQRGDCKYGDNCRLRHSLPPSNQPNRNEPTSLRESNQTEATPTEYLCGICFEDVVQAGKQFGLLTNCDHCFCIDCVRSWRQSKDQEVEVVRSCPQCRAPSNYIVPSLCFVTGAEKQQAIDAYKQHLSMRECKYFNGHVGSCPFGPHCFYAHRDTYGRDVKAFDRIKKTRRARTSSTSSHLSVLLDADNSDLEEELARLIAEATSSGDFESLFRFVTPR